MTVLRRNTKLKWVARLHFWVMFFSFFFYVGLGLTLGPEFLYQDIRKKLFAFADDTIVVTAVVPGPPAVPVISATPACVGLVPRITLNWADDIGTTSWDIDRDSLALTTGLTLSQYTDTAVVANTSYSYQITAYGPMFPGSAVSASVSATTLDCTSVVPVTVTIETLGGKNVRPENRANTDLSKRRPKVTGSTNTPYAILDITLTNPSIRARITANANGYFEWIPPIGLDTGNHILSVTATDPADGSRGPCRSLLARRCPTVQSFPRGRKVLATPVNDCRDRLHAWSRVATKRGRAESRKARSTRADRGACCPRRRGRCARTACRRGLRPRRALRSRPFGSEYRFQGP